MSLISVLICTHNPRVDYFERVLAAIREQRLPTNQWELIIVDNASRDTLSETWDVSWHARGRIVRENTLGLTAARLRAIEEAEGDLLVFVDDDNVLAADYLERALALAGQYPRIGVFGAGRLEPEFEAPPPACMRPYLQSFAIRTVQKARWSNNPRDHHSIPWGAGLCVRRAVAARFRQIVSDLYLSNVLGRRGNVLFSSEDDLFSWIASAETCGFGIFPELRLTHLIGASRLGPAYLLRLLHDKAMSSAVLHYLAAGDQPAPLDWAASTRVLLHGLRRGLFPMRCQWATARGTAAAGHFIRRQGLMPVDWPARAAQSRPPHAEPAGAWNERAHGCS
jgi:glycosyltransferase involved in cell wall biosynthesis